MEAANTCRDRYMYVCFTSKSDSSSSFKARPTKTTLTLSLHLFNMIYHGCLTAETAPLVIPIIPALEPTISMQKSGAWPVMPNMVVLRYFSCPARSMKVTTFEAARQM